MLDVSHFAVVRRSRADVAIQERRVCSKHPGSLGLLPYQSWVGLVNRGIPFCAPFCVFQVHLNAQVTEALSSKVLLSKKQISTSGRFAFTSGSKGGDYVFCFQNLHGSQMHRMSMTLKHGIDATDYDQLMKGKHFTELETDFTRMIDQMATLRKDFEYYKDRERESRNTTESTCERIFYFSIFGIFITCLSGVMTFFETKKEFGRHKLM